MEKTPQDGTRDFSNIKLKPAPLRLTHKSFRGSDSSHQSPSKSPLKHADGDKTPTLGSRPQGPPRVAGFSFLELTPQPSRAPAPALAGLVSKFEILDAVNSVDVKDLEKPVSPSKPTSPSKIPKPRGPRPLPDPRLLFAEGSPFAKPSRAGLLNSDAGLKKDDRRGWDPKSVSERRKIFEEQQIANERFAAPIVTHATVRSSKPVIVKHEQVISSLRASRAIDMDAQEPTAIWQEYSPTKSRSQSHRIDLYTPSSPRMSIEMKDSLKHKRHSVADLRLAFERAAQINRVASKQSSKPTTPKRRSIASSSESPTKIDVVKWQHPQTCPKPKLQTRSRDSKAAATPTQRSSLRSSVSTKQLPEAMGSKSVGSRTVRDIERHEKRSSIPRPSLTRPLLMARTLSVKISTVKPSSPESPTKNNIRGRIGQSRIDRKVLPGPPPSPFLQHWRTRRETAPIKSGPSLPIMVSTTVAVTTQRASSSADSSIPSASVSAREDDRRRSIASSAYSKGYQDGPVENPRKDTGDSPVKDKISIFEHLNNLDTKSPLTIARFQNHSASSSLGNSRQDQFAAKRPSASELKKGARALRALSLTGRRKSRAIRTTLPIPKNPDKAVKFPVRVRHSIAVSRGEETDGSAGDNNQRALGSKAMGVVARMDGYTLTPRPDSTFFVKGTMWKVPHTNPSPERPSYSRKASTISNSAPQPPSSTDLVHKTIDTRPNLFYSASSKTGRILPDRKSYGALEGKQSWDPHPLTGATLADPFLDSSTQNTDLYLQAAHVEFPAINLEPPTPVPNTTSSSSSTPALSLPILEPPIKFQKRPKLPIIASFGKKSGENAKKTAPLGPVLSPDLAHGRRSVSSDNSRGVNQTQSWGRRAAAAAMGITRRLRERRASSSTANSVFPKIVAGGGGGGEAEGGLAVESKKRFGRGSTSRSRSWSNRSLTRRDGSGSASAGASVGVGTGTGTTVVASASTINLRTATRTVPADHED
ncbi:hypothetical protein QBC43DRAFT_297031 [Cladorrhinum sp. PSN259]|nr:hypothetical protein QBC43DRAFT_297031 [Cladorrhinum sp. PSN259]